MKTKRLFQTMMILLTLAGIACNRNEPDLEQRTDAKEEIQRGPHKGRLFAQDDFSIEVTIYETGVPPEFRVYTYEKGKTLDPRKVRITAEVHRLGGIVDVIGFRTQNDYLRGDKTVYEPHSFDVVLKANYNNRNFQWKYSQVEGRVQMSDEALKSAGITLQKAGPATIVTTLSLPGEISPNQDKVAHILPLVSGIVVSVGKNVGDRVRKGDVLATINSRELADAGRDYVEANHRLELAKISYEREETLWKKKISSEEEYLNKKHAYEEAKISFETSADKLSVLGLSQSAIRRLLSEQRNLASYALYAPFAGVVLEKDVTAGEAVQPTDKLFVIGDLSTVWVNTTIYARDLAAVRPGQQVTIKSNDLNLEQDGELAFIGSLVGQQTRSATGRVVLPNPDGRWRPGLFVDVNVKTEETEVRVAVSVDAIQTFRDWDVVFAEFGNYFEVRPLELGKRDSQWVEVVEGIPSGTRYAAKNSFVLKAELGKSGATHDH